MTLAERLKQIADMPETESGESIRKAFFSALYDIQDHREERILLKCLIAAAIRKTEIYWGESTFVPETLKYNGFWVRREQEGKHNYFSFDTPPENSTTAEPTA